jgi:hypothetical protein
MQQMEPLTKREQRSVRMLDGVDSEEQVKKGRVYATFMQGDKKLFLKPG